MINKELSPRTVLLLEFGIILLFAALPLFTQLPYRVNIFLTWEGAYRMYLGQFPFKDFGLPLGYGFWIVPFMCFKVFGPYLYSLIIAQALLNLVSLVAFRGILKIFGLSPVQILVSVFTLCLSFVLINFWPWYNHTVFVFELVAIYFLVHYLFKNKRIVFLGLSAFFTALCIFTKQDAGGLSLMLLGAILLINSMIDKEIKSAAWFALFYALSLALLIIPLLQYDFTYWFNYGQPPHFSRINVFDLLTAFFEESLWIKFYIGCILIVLLLRFKSWKSIRDDKAYFLFSLLTLGVMVQAMIIQVTSFSPITVNYYFHSFAIAFLVFSLSGRISFEKAGVALFLVVFVLFWRSENYWKYSNKLLGKIIPSVFAPPPKNVVSKHSWSAESDSIKRKKTVWKTTPYPSMRRIKLPENTIDGINRIMTLDGIKGKKDLSVLNMSNLTPLAYELGYEPDHGADFPLWYHQGVAFFDREEDMLCHKIQQGKYDLILFEDMPVVDNFFPYGVRECARENNYQLIDRFIAPTGYPTDSVEVYIKVQPAVTIAE